MADWAPPPVPRSLQAMSVAAAARSAPRALSGTRGPNFDRLRETARGESTVHTSIAGRKARPPRASGRSLRRSH
eukprot:8073501-Pyramimonas_sp.AAC.1